MLGHVILAELDADYPVSFSRRIVQQVIRGEWGYRGLLVTDDLTMGAAYNRGLCDATVRALDAGVDLLLIAFDHDKYFDAMHCALQAAQRGALDLPMLERRGAQRLQSFR
jgi:beta-N-acetylhexosaminidase